MNSNDQTNVPEDVKRIAGRLQWLLKKETLIPIIVALVLLFPSFKWYYADRIDTLNENITLLKARIDLFQERFPAFEQLNKTEKKVNLKCSVKKI